LAVLVLLFWIIIQTGKKKIVEGKTSKRTIISKVLSLIVSIVLVIGSTFAARGNTFLNNVQTTTQKYAINVIVLKDGDYGTASLDGLKGVNFGRSYEKEKAIGAMTKVARGILNDSKIVVNDELLGNLVAEDAETTKTNVENFVKNFNDAVQKAVAEALRGKTPRLKDGSKELTKEDILKIKNRSERQKAMAEHPELFR